MTHELEIGRLLSAGVPGFTAGCRVDQRKMPAFGALVSVPLADDYRVFGIIYDIHIDEDGLIRQLVTSDSVSEEVIRDNRERRIVPVEISVLSLGCQQGAALSHLLPPRPPLSLNLIQSCTPQETARFTAHLTYLRHILRRPDLPIGELIAAHAAQVAPAHAPNSEAWRTRLLTEVITLLRDDYPTLMSVLNALAVSF